MGTKHLEVKVKKIVLDSAALKRLRSIKLDDPLLRSPVVTPALLVIVPLPCLHG